jgi:hypothetical protein
MKSDFSRSIPIDRRRPMATIVAAVEQLSAHRTAVELP